MAGSVEQLPWDTPHTVELLLGHGADVEGTDQVKNSSHSMEVQSWTTNN